MTREDWMKINKDYLIAEINLIKAGLRVHQDSLSGKKKTTENSLLLEQATIQLELIEKELTINTRLKSLVELFQLSEFEKKILLMGVGVELDASFGKLIAEIQGDASRQMPTLSLALSLFPEAHWSAITPEGPLRYWQLIVLNKSTVLTNASFSVDEIILHYLTGIDVMDTRLSSLVSAISTTSELVPSHQKIAEQIFQHLSKPTISGIAPIIQLEGNSSEDQKAIIAKIFSGHNHTVHNLPVQLLPTNFEELTNLIQLWNREAILNQYVLFLDAKELSSVDLVKTNHVTYFLEKTKGMVIISTEQKFTDLGREIHSIEVEKPKRAEQQLLWKVQLGTIAETLDGDISGLVTQFNLDSHTITHLAQMAVANNKTNGSPSANGSSVKEKLWSSCCNHTRPSLTSLAQRIETVATWDDLVLPPVQKATLEEVCVHVQQRQKVYYDWGFRSKSNRGLGIAALFAGESGTGKTMASEVIANALKLDLYRIDLSQVVNKYIGETEKNLKKIFDAAEDSGAILLFDEADALFGKRSEVKDSHDRHSNIEVSYLLQKMEEYRGLAILTTNMKNALDQAFLRRIRFVVQFPFPDAQLRAEIWNKVFPKQTPTNDLSIQKLANLNVAGGNIRNIALNASFAAAHKDKPVTMRDIHNAARNEYVKLEKHMSPSESLI